MAQLFARRVVLRGYSVAELSTIPLGATWLLRAFHMDGTRLYKRLLLLFVVLFFLIRVVGMTSVLGYVRQNERPTLKKIGVHGRTALYTAVCLQWYCEWARLFAALVSLAAVTHAACGCWCPSQGLVKSGKSWFRNC